MHKVPSLEEFVRGVDDWVWERRNRSVIYLQRDFADIMEKEDFIATIQSFLKQRLLDMYGISGGNIPKGFIKKATDKYIREVL